MASTVIVGAREESGDRAQRDGLVDDRIERVAVDVHDLGDDPQDGGDDGRTTVDLVQRDRRGHVESLGRDAVLAEPERERHREARGVGRRRQFLGARPALGLLDPRRPRHRQLVEGAAAPT